MPFDNRRHGMLLGMGAAGIVVESADAARERGIQPICEVLATVTANSAFHGTKLDVDHISAGHGGPRRPGRGARRRPPRHGPRDGVHVPRDLHAGARRERPGRDQRPAGGVRRRRRQGGHRQHQGVHRPPDGRRHRGRRRHQGARDRDRPAGAELQGGRPVPRGAQPVDRRRLPRAVCVAAGGGVRVADQHGAAAVDARPRRRSPAPRRAGLRVPDRRPRRLARGGCRRSAARDDAGLEVVQRRLRVVDTGPAAGRASTAAAAPAAVQTTAEPRRCPHRDRARAGGGAGA